MIPSFGISGVWSIGERLGSNNRCDVYIDTASCFAKINNLFDGLFHRQHAAHFASPLSWYLSDEIDGTVKRVVMKREPYCCS